MIKKSLFFLMLFISSISHANSFILWSQQSWFATLWEFCTRNKRERELKTEQKQEAMINQLHNEGESTFNKFKEVCRINGDDWKKILKQREQEKKDFLN